MGARLQKFLYKVENSKIAQKRGIKMNSNRKTAIIVGVLFIIGTAAGITSVGFTGSILDDPDYLIEVSANENRVITGALFEFMMAAATAGIAISLYPILKKHNEGIALGSVCFRIIESIIFMVGVIILLSLLTLSQEFVKAGAPDASYFQPLGEVLLAARESEVGSIAFGLGALMYYYLFYQSKLIPRFISVWGLLAIALVFADSLSTMFGLYVPFSTTAIIINLPIAVQEMVLAVWLIVKGFNSSAIASESAKTDIN